MEYVDSKESILSVAVKVFGRWGFKKTTMTDIANAAKKGRRTIYTYFKTKEDVYEAVINKEISNLAEKLKGIVYQDLDTRIKLKHYIMKRMISIKNLLNYHDALKIAFFEDKERFANIRYEFDKIEEKYLKYILQEGLERGEFKNLNTTLTTQNIMMSIKAFELPYFKELYTKDEEKHLNNIIEILLYGISN